MKKERSAWDKAVIRIGQVTLSLVIIAGFLPSLFLYFFYGVKISVSQMVAASVSIFVVYGAFYPIEPLTYYPSLGLAGTYMGWLAGNVGNIGWKCMFALGLRAKRGMSCTNSKSVLIFLKMSVDETGFELIWAEREQKEVSAVGFPRWGLFCCILAFVLVCGAFYGGIGLKNVSHSI